MLQVQVLCSERQGCSFLSDSRLLQCLNQSLPAWPWVGSLQPLSDHLPQAGSKLIPVLVSNVTKFHYGQTKLDSDVMPFTTDIPKGTSYISEILDSQMSCG